MSALPELLADLVRIDSINPDLIAGAAGEGEAARFVAAWLETAGLEVEVEEVAPGRFNAVGIARGSGGGKTLLLNAHMDTVGVAGMERPFEPAVENGRMRGRGSYDMKAGLAAIMLAGAEAARAGLRGDVLVTAVCDEEVASIGTARIAERYTADAAIVSEPTELRLALAHKGFVGFEIETKGRAAHGSRPDLGVDAIAHMGHVLVGIEELDRTLRAVAHARAARERLAACLGDRGRPGVLELPRTMPSQGRAAYDPGRDEPARRERAARPPGRDRRRGARGRRAATVRNTLPTRRSLSSSLAIPAIPRSWVHRFGPTRRCFASAGIPTVVFGPAGEGAHAVEEWVDLASARALRRGLCGRRARALRLSPLVFRERRRR